MTSKEDIKEKIVEVLRQMDENMEIKDDISLIDLDSYQQIQLVVQLEEEYNINISGEGLLEFTVESLVDTIYLELVLRGQMLLASEQQP